ncbi:hypothetical protein Lal_00030525 [Lupinus albus]|nr:hypothetical protein Lal_00030525 [Lupinus albus]
MACRKIQSLKWMVPQSLQGKIKNMGGGGTQKDPMSFINMVPPKDKDASIYGSCFVFGSIWVHSGHYPKVCLEPIKI